MHFFDIWTTSGRPKVVRTCSNLIICIENMLHASTACTFSTSQLPKNVPKLTILTTFHFHMCFAPQWLPLFRHLNLQKCSEGGVLCTFSLPHVFRATKACTFSGLFVHFHFQMCSAPQPCPLFPQLTFQKYSEPNVSSHFLFSNVLPTTTACTFPQLNFQKWSEPHVF